MIRNDKQYQVTKSRLSDFRESLTHGSQEQDPLLRELHENALKSQIMEFEKLIREYDLLKEGSVNQITIDNLSQLYEGLIKVRIARNLTQGDLAKKMELKEQQIQRYEMSNYAAASMTRVIEVAEALEIKFEKIKIQVSEALIELPSGIDENRVSRIRREKTLLQLL